MARTTLWGSLVAAVLLTVFAFGEQSTSKKEKEALAASQVQRNVNRPKVPGTLRLHLRERREEPKGSGQVKVVERTADWQVSETAIIICDMWDDHFCKMAAHRVGVMAPRMNHVLSAARDRGIMIIHAPSGTMHMYAGTPYRRRLEQAKAV